MQIGFSEAGPKAIDTQSFPLTMGHSDILYIYEQAFSHD